MYRILMCLLGLICLTVTVSTPANQALALGGCGPNHHRSSVTGKCIWGGQNQRWCERHTGRPAVKGPNGNWICIRT